MPTWASIDPGSGGTGWAIWDPLMWSSLVMPESWGVLMGTGSWQEQVEAISRKFGVLLESYKVERVYMEYPSSFESFGGQTSAKSGSLVKLAIAVGYLGATADRHGAQVIYVPVNDWKGQLQKDTVTMRIIRRLGEPAKAIKTHAIDATGIGLHCKGFPFET